MVEYDLTKDDTVKENILQKKSIREGATVLLTVALLMGSAEKIHTFSMMDMVNTEPQKRGLCQLQPHMICICMHGTR